MHRVRFTRHKLGPAICLMATLCVCCVAALADYDIPKYEIVTEPNIVYGRSLTRDLGVPVDLVLNAYLPKGAEAKDKPSIVFIHGNPGSNPYPVTETRALRRRASTSFGAGLCVLYRRTNSLDLTK